MKILHSLVGPLISLFVLGSVVVGLELWMRTIFYDVSVGSGGTPGSERFYKTYYKGNLLGWRDENYSEAKPKKTIRIMTLGDSFTFGSGIKQVSDTWPRLMEAALREEFPNLNLEVLNAARRGADTDDVATILESKGMGFEPDIVIYALNLNDIEMDADRLKLAADSQVFKGKTGRYLVAHYYTVYALEQVIRGLQSDTNNDVYIQKLMASSEHRANQQAAIQKMRSLLGGQPFFIGVLPNAPIHGRQTLQIEYDAITEMVRSLGANLVDLEHGLPATEPSDYRVSVFDYHPNEEMHVFFAKQFTRAVAGVIAEKYAKQD